MLVRTPPHALTESLLGYVLRVSETNGYETPWHILRYAGLLQAEMSTPSFPVAKLASILGRPPEALHDISYVASVGAERGFVILGHHLGGSFTFRPLRLRRPALCPECVSDRGFIEAFFDLSLVVACPVHGRELLFRCEVCEQQLSHFRPGLLVCKCGATLLGQCRRDVSDRVIALMAVLKANLERTHVPSGTPVQGLPVQNLLGMPLRSLLVHLPKFSQFNRPAADSISLEAVDGVAEALEDWPHGFHRFLRRHGQSRDAPTFHKRFEKFSESFFGVPQTRREYGWLHTQFLEFGMMHANGSIVDPRTIPGRVHKRRFVSLRDLSKRIGHDVRSLEAWSRKGLVDVTSMRNGASRRFIVDLEAISLPPRPEKTDILGKREAAAWLGMPLSVLTRLRNHGHFKVFHHLEFRTGYHQADLEAFRKQLLAPSPKIEHAALPELVVSLKQMLSTSRLHSVEHKTQLVIAYLDGRFLSVGRTGETIADIYFEKRRVAALAAASRAVIARGTLTHAQAAQAIGCNVSLIPGLLARNFLKKTEVTKRFGIDATSVESFAHRYVQLSNCASDWDTSSLRLKRICRHAHVRVFHVPHRANGEVPFISRRDIQSLHDALNLENSYQSSKAPREIGPDPIVLLRRYLANLSYSNEPLPWRDGQPNKMAIAKACGFDRDVFYSNAKAIKILLTFARGERKRRTAAGNSADSSIARLRSYLDQLKRDGKDLPSHGGHLNKRKIAESAGVNRNLFYNSVEALQMLEIFRRRA